MQFRQIPKRVKHPGGFWVRIVQLEHAEFKRRVGRSKALYEPNDLIIYLDLSRSHAQRLADFAHEYVHSGLDWQAEVLNCAHVDPKG